MQELSSHLAAEITRLCSLAKQDELPLSQEMCVYEMEVRTVTGAALQFHIYTGSITMTPWAESTR